MIPTFPPKINKIPTRLFKHRNNHKLSNREGKCQVDSLASALCVGPTVRLARLTVCQLRVNFMIIGVRRPLADLTDKGFPLIFGTRTSIRDGLKYFTLISIIFIRS